MMSKSNGGAKKSPAPSPPSSSVATDVQEAFDGKETVVKISGGSSFVHSFSIFVIMEEV